MLHCYSNGTNNNINKQSSAITVKERCSKVFSPFWSIISCHCNIGHVATMDETADARRILTTVEHANNAVRIGVLGSV